MTLTDIKDYLKQQVDCGRWFTGKADSGPEFSITVFPGKASAPHAAIGGRENTSYAKKAVSLLIRWGKYAEPAEQKAREIYESLAGQETEINGYPVFYFEMQTWEPVGIGTDENGIYEYVINFVIYYGTEKGMI